MKTYVKPELYYESFELSQHIAGCNLELKQGDVLDCLAEGTIGIAVSDSWFVEANTNCRLPVEDYCYTNGTTNLATINS